MVEKFASKQTTRFICYFLFLLWMKIVYVTPFARVVQLVKVEKGGLNK